MAKEIPGRTHRWRNQLPNAPTVFPAHENYVLDVCYTQDGETLISSGMDSKVNVWSTGDWRLVRTLHDHANSVNCLSLSPHQTILATGSTDQTVKLWDFPAGTVLHTLRDRKKTVAAVQIAPKGAFVAAASYGGHIAVWTLEGEPVVGIKVSKKNLGSVAISPDGQMLATSGLGDNIWVYALPSGELLATLVGHEIAVSNLTFIEAGETLVSKGYEQSIKFWDTAIWTETRSLQGASPVRGFIFSADEQHVALSMERLVQIRRVADWTLQLELPVSTRVINGLDFSPDGRWLAAAAADKKIRV